MRKWMIISDSSCDCPVSMIEDAEIGFSIASLKILVDQTEYVDDDSIDIPTMLEHMKAYKGASSSACPSIEDFATRMRLSENSIVVAMTSALSGTYNSAVRAREIVLEESPEKKIYVMDNHSTSPTSVLDIIKAKELIQSGKEFEQIVTELEQYNDGLGFYFTLASYDNLIKTGRMSAVAGMFAKALNIRAIATNTPQGTIEVVEKPLGETNAIRIIVEKIASEKDITGLPVVITHCQNIKGATLLKEKILEKHKPSEVMIFPTKGLASFYSGSGGLLVSF